MVFRTQLLLGLGAVLRCLLLLIALTTLLGLPGCRSVDNAQLDLLERELRQQESYIYELEDNLVEYSEKLRKCRCANQAHMNVVKTPERDVERIPEPELASDPALDQGDAAQVPDLADDPPPEPATPSETLETPGPTQDGTEEGQSDTIDLEQLDNLDVPDLEIGPSGE